MATGAAQWHGGVNKGACLNEALNITSPLWASLTSRHERCVCEGPRVYVVPDYVSRTGLWHAKAFNCKSQLMPHTKLLNVIRNNAYLNFCQLSCSRSRQHILHSSWWECFDQERWINKFTCIIWSEKYVNKYSFEFLRTNWGATKHIRIGWSYHCTQWRRPR